MARTVINPVDLSSKTTFANITASPAKTAVDTTNNNYVVLTGLEVIVAENTTGSSVSFTIVGAPDSMGRSANLVDTIPANGRRIYGPFRQTLGWAQSDGTLYINGVTGTVVTVMRMSNT